MPAIVLLRGHVVSTAVHTTKRSTTDHVVRSNSLRYHVDVKQFGDIFHSFEPEECMRTSVRATPHVCCQLYNSTSLQSNKSQPATPSRKPQDSSPYPSSVRKYSRSVSFHVPRCTTPSKHMSHRMRPNELRQDTYSNNVMKTRVFKIVRFRMTFFPVFCELRHRNLPIQVRIDKLVRPSLAWRPRSSCASQRCPDS